MRTPLSARRHAAELQQGALLAGLDAESIWGWGGAVGALRAERRASMLSSFCVLSPGVRCLELGAGTGAFTERLARTNCQLVAVELSPATAGACRERLGDRAEVVVGDIQTRAGLEGREFDAIVGVSVLHHVDIPTTLRTTFSLLAPGGRFAFSEPNLLNPQVWAERNIGWVARKRHVLDHETAFTARSLRRAFEAAGFIVDVAMPFEFLHPATPTAAVAPVRLLERLLEATPARIIAGSVFVAGRRPR